jgi:hypothetical protein
VKFTAQDLDTAIADLSMCQFFPADEATRSSIQLLLVKMCPNREALTWLVDQFVNRIGEWRGAVELRAVLCWHYRPADGIEATSAIAGYSADDGERANYDQQQQLKAGGWTEGAEPRRIEAPMAPEPLRLVAGLVKEWPR